MKTDFELYQYVNLVYQERQLQMRVDQVSINSLARTFRLIPETIILVSEMGTVAIPDESGTFPGLDTMINWTVEGDAVSSRYQPSPLALGPKTKGKWKPQLLGRTTPPIPPRDVSVCVCGA